MGGGWGYITPAGIIEIGRHHAEATIGFSAYGRRCGKARRLWRIMSVDLLQIILSCVVFRLKNLAFVCLAVLFFS